MKKFTIKVVLLLVLSISLTSCAQGSSAKKSDVVSLISAQDLNKITDDIQLIDIRTPKEFADGHIEDAKLIDYYAADFMDKMSKLDKNKDLYIYCRSGNRSGKAAKKLESLGFPKIYDLEGGIIKWNRNNMKVVK